MLWLIFWMFLIPAAISLAKALIHFVCCHHFSSLPFFSGSKKISTCRDANIVKWFVRLFIYTGAVAIGLGPRPRYVVAAEGRLQVSKMLGVILISAWPARWRYCAASQQAERYNFRPTDLKF
jgi:hypothetical protein